MKEETACETQAKMDDVNLDEDIVCEEAQLTQLARDNVISSENDNKYRFT
jgi:hypothetical protein